MKTSKKILSILIAILVIYIIGSFCWSLLNTQTCTIEYPKNATCEQIAENNSKNCKYLVLRWKKVDYSKELQSCKDWESRQNINSR